MIFICAKFGRDFGTKIGTPKKCQKMLNHAIDLKSHIKFFYLNLFIIITFKNIKLLFLSSFKHRLKHTHSLLLPSH